ncbi:hypothetical protein OH686_22340 [Pseudomonas sp. SO81]|nr:hypothetical protein OH686_22340 [Pseudomonas sp. SO81]
MPGGLTLNPCPVDSMTDSLRPIDRWAQTSGPFLLLRFAAGRGVSGSRCAASWKAPSQ